MKIKINKSLLTDVGLVRNANEDSIGYSHSDDNNGNGTIFVVCDGMGGHIGGTIASKTAVERIIEYFKKDYYDNPFVALNNAITFANEQIYLKTKTDSSLSGMGTTCTILLFRDDKFYIAHVGDSRGYIYDSNKIYRLTKDHSYVQQLVDSGLDMTEEEMESHPRKNEILRALGISNTVNVEVSSIPITPKTGSKILLCSDGLCGLVTDAKICDIISNGVNIDTISKRLVDSAKEAGGHDNISVILIDVLSSPHQKSTFDNKNLKQKTSNQSKKTILNDKENIFYKLLKDYKKEVSVLSALLIVMIGFFSFYNPGNRGGSDVGDSTNFNDEIKHKVDTANSELKDSVQNDIEENKNIPKKKLDINKDNIDQEAHLVRANKEYKAGNYSESVSYFEKHYADYQKDNLPVDDDYYIQSAKAYCMNNQYAKSLDNFKKVQLQDIKDKELKLDYYIFNSLTHFKLNKNDEAKQLINNALSIENSNTRALIISFELKFLDKRNKREKCKEIENISTSDNSLENYFITSLSSLKQNCTKKNKSEEKIERLNKIIKDKLEKLGKIINNSRKLRELRNFDLSLQNISNSDNVFTDIKSLIDTLKNPRDYKVVLDSLKKERDYEEVRILFYSNKIEKSGSLIDSLSSMDKFYFDLFGPLKNYIKGTCAYNRGNQKETAIKLFKNFLSDLNTNDYEAEEIETYIKLCELEPNNVELHCKSLCDLSKDKVPEKCPKCNEEE